MKTADVLHETAMDLYDLGRVYRSKGDAQAYNNNLKKAFLIEKEAAFLSLADEEDSFWKYVYVRTAAELAIKCEKLQEAQGFLEIGLAGTPPTAEKVQLEDTLERVINKIKLEEKNEDAPAAHQQIFGVISAIFIEQKSIQVRQIGRKEVISISIIDEDVNNIARFFTGKLVQIKTESEVLKQIQFAA